MLLGLPKDLAVLVASKFAAAKETGALVFSATQLSIIRASGIPVSQILFERCFSW